MPSSPLFLLVLWSIPFATASPNSGICYDSYRIQDPNTLVCDSEAEVSSCCSLNSVCLSNGLCATPVTNTSRFYEPYYKGDCTDYLWNSPLTCPAICNNNKTNPSNGIHVWPCEAGNYCCSGSSTDWCCNTRSLLFTLGSDPVTLEGTIPPSWIFTTSTTAIPSSAVLSSLVSSPSSKDPPSSAAALTPPSLSSATTVATPASSPRPRSNHVVVGASVGVGVGAGLALLGGLVYLLRRRSNTAPNNPDDTKGCRMDIRDRFEIADGSGSRVRELSGQNRAELSEQGHLELPGQGLVELQHTEPPRVSRA